MSSERETYPRKFGNYHLLGPLAQGGMGALYLAASGADGLERLLVVKTVLPHLADAEYVARFRDEAKTVVKLSHGNLVPVFDAGQVDGELFLAMEFVEGKDLRAIWNRCAQRGVAFPIDVAVHMVKEVCRGLGYAHRFGDINLVHRDVSPPNILVSYAGEVKLTDFGLASSTLKMEKTAPGVIYGKVAYMSPEQARGETLDGRSDIYAAGIILWELLTGRQLFPPGKAQPHELLNRAKHPTVQPPSERAPRVPPGLDSICLKAIMSERDGRYATAEEFRTALSEWLAVEAPTTDAVRVETFLERLFAEDIEEGRRKRQALLAMTQDRVKTLPPTHELRKIMSNLDSTGATDGGTGRRSSDHDTSDPDRRQADRRLRLRRGSSASGGAVDVPKASPDGRTVVPSSHQSGAAAAVVPDPARPPTELIGQLLDGRYKLTELLGEGGMGRVYLAEHVAIGKLVAVKILHLVYSRMPELVERFRREARAASRIGHPHIVDVTDSGKTRDGSAYFVMEYLDGVDLATVVARQSPLSIERSLRIGSQICRALAAAHASGIIHRDLKPENVFLIARDGSSDFVKVLDFGIAKSTEAEQARTKKLTQPGLAMGTPEYMAPEQAAGLAANERSDIYSVGAILYEMITGTPPYDGQNFMEILAKKASHEPAPLSTLRADIPESVEEVVLTAMSRKIEDRPASMDALDYELTKCLSGRGPAVARVIGLRGIGGDFVSEDPTPPPGARPITYPEDELSSARSAWLAPKEAPSAWKKWAQPLPLGVLAAVVLVFGTWSVFSRDGDRKDDSVAQHTSGPPVRQTPPPLNPDGPSGVAGTTGTDVTPTPVVEPPPVTDPVTDPILGPVEPEFVIIEDDPPAAAEDDPKKARRAVEKWLREARTARRRLNWKRAQALYQRVASGSYRRSSGYLGLAEVAFQTKKNDKVIKYAKRAGKSNRALTLLGHAYFKQGKYAQALSYYERVLKRTPGNREVRGAARAARAKLGR